MLQVQNKAVINIILYLWLCNIIIYSIVGFFPRGLLNLTDIRAAVNGIIVIILLFYSSFNINNSINRSIYIFLFYLFILVIFSSNTKLSLEMVAKVSMSTLMFVIGNYFIRSFNNFRKLMIYYFIFYLFLLATIFFSNISGIGHIDYDESENAFLYGGVGVSMTGIIMLVLILVPQVSIILKSKIYRYFIIGLFIVGLLLVVISTKRSALLGLFTSVLTFLLLYKRRFMLLLPLLTITLILYIFHPVYKDVLIRSYETRETSFYGISENAGDIEEEARYNETSLVINSFKSDNIIHKLFGSELFNEFEYFKTERMLHIDFNVLLNGAGIFGLFLLFRIYFLIVIKALSYRRIFKNRFLHLVAISIIIYVVLAQFVSIGGSIRSIDFRGLLFLYIGSALGFLENEYKRIKINHVAH